MVQDNAARLTNASEYDYLKAEVAERLLDRVDDVKRTFSDVLNIGAGPGHLVQHLRSRPGVERVVLTESSGAF